MNLNDIPLFSMMKSRMSYLTERQQLISQNVANADTPAFTPKDLKAFTLTGPGTEGAGSGQLAMALPSGSGALAGAMAGTIQPVRTDPAHFGMSAAFGSGEWQPVDSADSESKIDGNKVVVEDEMSKLTASRLDYQAVIGFYEKALDMLKMAGTAPGK